MKTWRLVPPILLGVLSGSSASGQGLVARINAGGPAVTDDLGQGWSADQPYVAGSSDGYEGGTSLEILPRLGGILLGGHENPLRRVHNLSRVGWSAYRFEVPDGDYIVRLTLAEVWNQGPGLRSVRARPGISARFRRAIVADG